MKQLVTTYDLYGRPHKASADNLKLSVHVYGIAEKGGEVLISPQFDGFDFPGGTAEKGETHFDTLVREFKEETGYDIEPIDLVGVYTSFFHHIKKLEDYQGYLIFYRVKIIGGELSTAGFGDSEKEYAKLARWATLDELKTLRHVCSVDIIDDLLNKITASV